jgi:TP901 family phage tail tape measure protein
MAINLDVHGNTTPLEASVRAAVDRIRRKPIKITVDDKGATQPLGNMKRSADEFSKSMEAANARIIAFGASMAVLNGIGDAFKAMVRDVVQVEKALQDINVVMGLSAQNLDRFSSGLFKVAKETGAAFNVAAEAATEYARQGLTMEESLKRTRDALILTRITGMDSANAVKALTAAMNTYGHQVADTTELVSKFAAVDVKFAVSAEDFADAIARTGAAAKGAGVDINQLIGIVTAAQQKTARGGKVIGNSLKTIFTRVGKTNTLDTLESVGIAVRDLEGKTINATKILSDLASTFDKLSAAQQAQVAQTVGGVFQINILKAVLGDAAKANGIQARATQIASGATDDAIKKNEMLRQTMAALASETGMALKELSARVGDLMLAPGMEKILNMVKGVAEGVGDILGDGQDSGDRFAKGFLSGIGNIITGPGLVVTVAVFGKLFFKAFQYMKDSMKSLIGITSQSEKQKAIQMSLVDLFGRNTELNKEMLRTDISRVEKEGIILELLRSQVNEANALNGIASSLSKTMFTSGYGANLTKKGGSASGYIPNFAKGGSERNEARKGGYAPGAVKTMKMPGAGQVTYNTAETVKRFPQFSQPAIMPPEGSRAGKNYKQGFGSVHGFNPYASQGYIPNFSTATSSGSMKSGFELGKAGLAEKNVKNAIDLSSMFTMLTLKQGGSGSASIIPDSQYGIKGGAGGDLPKITFGVRGLDRSKVEDMAGSHDAFDVMRERLKDAVVPKGVEFGNNMQLGKADRTNNKLMSNALSQGSSGALGALSGLVGAVFEAAISTRLPHTDPGGAVGRLASVGGGSATKVGGDFDVTNISSSKELQTLFGSGIADIGDYKTASGKQTNKSMANKIAKEMIYRKHPAFVGSGSQQGKGLYHQKDKNNQYKVAYGKDKGATSGPLSNIKTLRDSFVPKISNPDTDYYDIDSGEYGKGGARGFIPNYAGPLSDAIGRERGAGIPVSKIRVGSHSRLMGRGNPLGLGVTNTRDEPRGLRDVVPNFADPDPNDRASMMDRVLDKLHGALDKWGVKLKETQESLVDDFVGLEKNAAAAAESTMGGADVAKKMREDNKKAAVTEMKVQGGWSKHQSAEAFRKLGYTQQETQEALEQLGHSEQISSNIAEAAHQAGGNSQSGGPGGLMSRLSGRARQSRVGGMLHGAGERLTSGTTGMALMMGAPMLAGMITEGNETSSAAQATGGAMTGMATGASMGMMFGPWGAAIGAAGGALHGLVGGLNEAEKAMRSAAQATWAASKAKEKEVNDAMFGAAQPELIDSNRLSIGDMKATQDALGSKFTGDVSIQKTSWADAFMTNTAKNYNKSEDVALSIFRSLMESKDDKVEKAMKDLDLAEGLIWDEVEFASSRESKGGTQASAEHLRKKWRASPLPRDKRGSFPSSQSGDFHTDPEDWLVAALERKLSEAGMGDVAGKAKKQGGFSELAPERLKEINDIIYDQIFSELKRMADNGEKPRMAYVAGKDKSIDQIFKSGFSKFSREEQAQAAGKDAYDSALSSKGGTMDDARKAKKKAYDDTFEKPDTMGDILTAVSMSEKGWDKTQQDSATKLIKAYVSNLNDDWEETISLPADDKGVSQTDTVDKEKLLKQINKNEEAGITIEPLARQLAEKHIASVKGSDKESEAAIKQLNLKKIQIMLQKRRNDSIRGITESHKSFSHEQTLRNAQFGRSMTELDKSSVNYRVGMDKAAKDFAASNVDVRGKTKEQIVAKITTNKALTQDFKYGADVFKNSQHLKGIGAEIGKKRVKGVDEEVEVSLAKEIAKLDDAGITELLKVFDDMESRGHRINEEFAAILQSLEDQLDTNVKKKGQQEKELGRTKVLKDLEGDRKDILNSIANTSRISALRSEINASKERLSLEMKIMEIKLKGVGGLTTHGQLSIGEQVMGANSSAQQKIAQKQIADKMISLLRDPSSGFKPEDLEEINPQLRMMKERTDTTPQQVRDLISPEKMPWVGQPKVDILEKQKALAEKDLLAVLADPDMGRTGNTALVEVARLAQEISIMEKEIAEEKAEILITDKDIAASYLKNNTTLQGTNDMLDLHVKKSGIIADESERKLAAERKALWHLHEQKTGQLKGQKRSAEEGGGTYGGSMKEGYRAARRGMQEEITYFEFNLAENVTTSFRDGMVEAMQAAINGADDLGDVLGNIAINFLQMIQKAFLQNAANMIVSGVTGGGDSGGGGKYLGGPIRNYAKGGAVNSMVTNGEYVMSPEAVQKYGGSFMHSLNARGKIPGYKEGGLAPLKSGRTLTNTGNTNRLDVEEPPPSIFQGIIEKLESNRLSSAKQIQPGSMLSARGSPAGGGKLEYLGDNSNNMYQKRHMSSYFYSGMAGNQLLNEDSSSSKRNIEEASRKAVEKTLKRKQRQQQMWGTLISTTASMGVNLAMNKIGGAIGKGGVLTKAAKTMGYSASNPPPEGQHVLVDTQGNAVASVPEGHSPKQSGYNVVDPYSWNPMKWGSGPDTPATAMNMGAYGSSKSSGADFLSKDWRNQFKEEYGYEKFPFYFNKAGAANQTDVTTSRGRGGIGSPTGVRGDAMGEQGHLDWYKGAANSGLDVLDSSNIWDTGGFRFAKGGIVKGKSGIDQIPAMLSEGEYVIKANSAQAAGKPLLDKINAGKFAEGGPVGKTESLMEKSDSSMSGGVTNNVNISVNVEKGGGGNKKEDSIGANPSDAAQDENKQKKLGERIRASVVQTIREEQRPGGLLYD